MTRIQQRATGKRRWLRMACVLALDSSHCKELQAKNILFISNLLPNLLDVFSSSQISPALNLNSNFDFF